MERGGGLDPLALLPIAALGGDLPDVDLRVEVRGEGLAVAARVAVDDVDLVDLRHIVLLEIRAEDAGHAGVEARAEQGHEPGFFEPVLVGPLPLVLELGGVERLVIGGVHVVHAGFEAGVHDVQVLVGEGHVDHEVRLVLPEQGDRLRHIVSVHLRGGDLTGELLGERVALGFGARGDHDVGENFGDLRALVGDDRADTAGTDEQNFRHGRSFGELGVRS